MESETLKSGRRVSRRVACAKGISIPEVEANARLIAAAPDLLTACIWAEAALAPFSKEPCEKSGINLLRAAIAKATGGQS